MRIDKLNLDPVEHVTLKNKNAHLAETQKQQKINKYLTGTLKHLNMTVDILIEQYDPVKIKNQKKLNEYYASPEYIEQQQVEAFGTLGCG